jgi:hypothetical protein
MSKKKHGPVVAGLVLLGLVFLWGCGSSGGGSPEGGGPPVAVTGVELGITGSSNIALDEDPATRQLAWQVIPANAANQTVEFTTSDSSIATVNAAGLVTAVSVGGPVTITVSADDGNFTKTVSVTVVANTVSLMGITIDEGASLTLTGPESKALHVTLDPTGATEGYEWSTNDGNTVAVTQGGIITAKKVGSATITVAKIGTPTVNDTIAITVVEPQRGIKITGLPSSLNDKGFELGIFPNKPTSPEDESDVADASGTIASGTIDVADLKNSGNSSWMGTGNFWIGIMAGDGPEDGKIYVSKTAVGFSFDIAKPELTLSNFDDMTDAFLGGSGDGAGPGSGEGGEYSITVTGIPSSLPPEAEYSVGLFTNNSPPFGMPAAGNSGTITSGSMTIALHPTSSPFNAAASYYVLFSVFVDDGYATQVLGEFISAGPVTFSGGTPTLSYTDFTELEGEEPGTGTSIGKSVQINNINVSGANGKEVMVYLSTTNDMQGFPAASGEGTISSGSVTVALVNDGETFNTAVNYYVYLMILDGDIPSGYVSNSPVSFSSNVVPLGFINDFAALTLGPSGNQ